ncbi:hypothetical protein ABZP36_033996 [Zizania latifolia]
MFHTDDFSEQEEHLGQFDMDLNFGPCIGVTRLQRWERASAMDPTGSSHGSLPKHGIHRQSQ